MANDGARRLASPLKIERSAIVIPKIAVEAVERRVSKTKASALSHLPFSKFNSSHLLYFTTSSFLSSTLTTAIVGDY
jgi:hypothetical protein